MIKKIGALVMLGIPACVATYTTFAWWKEFGAHEVYPYLGTFLCILLWTCMYLTYKEED